MNILLWVVFVHETQKLRGYFSRQYPCPVSRAPDLEMMRIFSPLTLVR